MIENNPLAEEIFREDVKRIIERGERTICVNPKCFDDCCRGECEQEEECSKGECQCRNENKKV